MARHHKFRFERRLFRGLLWAGVAVCVIVASLLRWGGYLLISDDPLPDHVDTAVVLQGSILGENARMAGAVRVLEQGKTNRILVSIPRESYWGEQIAPIALAYIGKHYGQDIASHIDFCETDDVDSTEEEAEALAKCISHHEWRSITVVTSDYHTRRTGIIWRRMLRKQHAVFSIAIHAVPDPEFHASRWWLERRSAKTWLLESTKLIWTLVGIGSRSNPSFVVSDY